MTLDDSLKESTRHLAFDLSVDKEMPPISCCEQMVQLLVPEGMTRDSTDSNEKTLVCCCFDFE